MAKKTDKHGIGDVDLEDIDLDLDIDAGDEPADDRSPEVKVATGFLSGIKDAVTDPGIIRRSVLAALPREYSEAYQTLDSTVTQASGLYHQISRDLRPSIREFKRAARQAKGLIDPILSETVKTKLNEWLAGDDDRRRVETNPQESAINTGLAEIFKQQASAAEQQQATQMISEQLADKRFKTNATLVDDIRRNLSRLVAYQDSITISYQRKSLELQFRQLYATKDQLELSKGYVGESLTLMRAIQKNTALPDQVKVRGSEILQQLLQENLYGKVQQSLVQNTGSFMRQLLKNVGTQANELAGGVKEGLGVGTDILNQTSMIDPDMLADADMYEDGGRLAGQQAGEWLAGKAAHLFKHSRFGKSKGVSRWANKVGRWNGSIPDMARDWANSPTENMGLTGWLTDIAKSVVPRLPTKQSIGLESLENSALPTPFDKGTRRSIMEIIPGYLARILQSSEKARLQTEDVPLVKFDQTRQEFVGAGVAGSRLLKRLLPKFSLDTMEYDSGRLIDKVAGKDVDPELRKGLQSELISRAMKGKGFKPEEFTNPKFYKTMKEEDAKKAAALFQQAFGQDGDTTESNLAQATTLFRRLRQSVPLIENQANAFASTGSLDLLRQLGVITRSGTRDVINDEFITSLMKDYIGSNSNYEHATGEADSSGPSPFSGSALRSGNVSDHRGYGRNFAPATERVAPLGSAPVETHAFDYDRLNKELERVIEAIQSGSSKDETTRANEVLTEILTAIKELELRGGTGEYNPANDQALIRKSTVLRGMGKAARFAWGSAKGLYNTGKWARNKTLGALGIGARFGLSSASRLTKWGFGKTVEDAYIAGNLQEPALFAYKMRAGHYRDATTGKEIKNVSQIKGPVRDITTDSIVLSGEDFQKGLVNAQGKELIRSPVGWLAGKAGWAAGVLGKHTWLSMSLPFKALSAANWARRHILMRPSDVYVPGERSPRLLATLLLNGGYYSKRTGKPVRSVGDIDSDVVDSEGNVKLSLEEFAAGVVDSRGKPIRTMAGKLKGLLNTAVDLGVGVVKFGARQIGRGFSMVGSVLKGGAKLLTGMAPSVHFGGKFGGEGSAEQTDVLVKIHNLLCRHFGEESQVIETDAPGGGGISRVKRFGQAAKAKMSGAASIAENVTTKLRSVFASALGKQESDLDGKETFWERMRNRAGKFRKGSAEDIAARRAAKGGSVAADDKPQVQESKGISGKILAVIMGIGGLLKTAVGKLGGLLTGFWELRKVLLMAQAAKTGADALDTLGGLGDGPDADGKGKKGKGKGGWFKRAASREGLKRAGSWVATRGAAAGALALAAPGAMASVGGAALTGAGAVLGALFSAPALIGLAVAGAAYGGYKLYQYYDPIAAPMQRARFAQYGVSPDDNIACRKLIEFEEMVMPFVSVRGDQVSIEGDIDYVAWMEHFGFDPESDQNKEGWGRWYQGRFKPVLGRWLKLIQLTSPSSKLLDIDKSMDDSLKAEFIRKTKFNRRDVQPYPYDVTAIPILGESAIDSKIIDIEIKAVWDRYREARKERPTNGTTVTTENGTSTVTTSLGTVPKASGSNSITMGGQLKYISQGQADASPIVKKTSGVSDFSFGQSRVIDDLAALRVKTYGLTDLDVAKVNVLLDLEDSVITELKIQPSGQASFDGSVSQYYEDYSSKFGLSSSDLEQQAIWQLWFLQRFIPTLLNYVAAVRKADKTVAMNVAATRLSATQVLAVAEAIRSAKTDIQGKSVSVWNVNASPFAEYAINMDPSSVRGYFSSLQNKTTALTYKDPTPFRQESGVTGKSGAAAKTGNFLPKFGSADLPMTQAMKSATAEKPVYKDLVSSSPVMIRGSGSGGSGTYKEIPRPKGNGSWEAIKDTVTAAASAVGVDPALLGAMAKIESSYDTNAVSPIGAKGLFQFLGSTWQDMQKLYGEQYGVPPDATADDPVAASIFAANYIKWNMDQLERKIPRQLTATDLYAAHFLGHAGAARLLKADPNAIAADIFPGPSKSNPNVFWKGQRPITIAELYQWLDGRVNGSIPSGFALAKAGPASNGGSVLEANGQVDPNQSIGKVGGMTQEERDQSKAATTVASAPLKQASKVPQVSLASSYAASAPAPNQPSVTTADYLETPAMRDTRIEQDLKLRAERSQRQQVELARVSATNTRSQSEVLAESLAVQRNMDGKLGEIQKALLGLLNKAPTAPEPMPKAMQTAQATTTSNPARPDFPVSLQRRT